MRLIITGFGSFQSTSDNPSAHVARELQPSAPILEVTYAAVDTFLEALDPSSFDALLMLGFSPRARILVDETTGHNRYGSLPDMAGEVRSGALVPSAPEELEATLWTNFVLWQTNFLWHVSHDAGSYMCNYALYSALHRFPHLLIGFLHVPSLEVMSLDKQAAGVEQILNRCTPSWNQAAKHG